MSIYLKRCDFCHSGIENPMVCSKCEAAPYCNRACQKAHWKEHKQLCCKDITILSKEEGEKLAFSLLEKAKKDLELFEILSKALYDNQGLKLTVLSATFDRPKKEFINVKILTMSVAEYQKATNMMTSKYTHNIKDIAVTFIIYNERNQLMINGTIPLG